VPTYSLACLLIWRETQKNLLQILWLLKLENFSENIQNGMKELAGKIGVWDLRLISLPFFCFNLILPWLKVFPIPQLSLGFPRLIALMNFFPSAVPQPTSEADYLFSSA